MRNDGSLDELKQTLSQVLEKIEAAVSSQAARFARRPSRARVRRRRLIIVALVIGLAGVAAIVFEGAGPLEDAVREITLPLHHEDIIRQQADDKQIDPALIAAVIYEESRFRDQTSHAGARGLMQITPETAEFIARRSGGVLFEQADLATPQINIAYGAWYLRYLIRPLRGQRDARDRGLQRGPDQRRPLGEAGRRPGPLRQRPPHPVPGDARLRGERPERAPDRTSTASDYAGPSSAYRVGRPARGTRTSASRTRSRAGTRPCWIELGRHPSAGLPARPARRALSASPAPRRRRPPRPRASPPRGAGRARAWSGCSTSPGRPARPRASTSDGLGALRPRARAAGARLTAFFEGPSRGLALAAVLRVACGSRPARSWRSARDTRVLGPPSLVAMQASRPRTRSFGCRPHRAAHGRVRPATRTPSNASEGVLQRLSGVEVEVVGRLVEDQHVRLRRHQDGERQAAPLAAGQPRHRLLGLLAREEEAAEQRARLAGGEAGGPLCGLEHGPGRAQLLGVLGEVAEA